MKKGQRFGRYNGVGYRQQGFIGAIDDRWEQIRGIYEPNVVYGAIGTTSFTLLNEGVRISRCFSCADSASRYHFQNES